MSKRGRSSKFNERLSNKIIELAEKGKTDKQIADIVGVTERTIHNWKLKDPDFFHSLKEAKQAADELVEVSLFRRATGYSHKAVKIFQFNGEIITHEYTEHYPPDTTAAIFWLKNRQPENWRDEKSVGFSDDTVKKLVIKMSDDE